MSEVVHNGPTDDTHSRGRSLSGDPGGSQDGDEPEIQTLPLDAWHRARGGRMVPFAGYHMPVQYDGIMAEHLWTRESAGLFDVSHMGQLQFTGEGTDAALEAMLPADIAGLKLNQARYSLLLNDGGGILDDLMLTRWADDHVYMVVNGATKYDDVGHLIEQLSDDVTLNMMDDHALLALQGPKAVDALARVVPGVEALVFMHGAAFDWQGGELWISRSGYTGEDGFEISVPAEQAVALADALCAEPEVKPIGLGARDSLRLEAGLPLYGHDLDPETTPVMADLGFALSKRRRDGGGFPRTRPDHAGAQPGCDHQARRADRRGSPAGPRRRGGDRRRRKRCRPRYFGRLRAHPRRADRDGLCADCDGRTRHPGHPCPARQAPPRDRRGHALRSPPLRQRKQVMRYFTQDHEWIEVDGEIATVGITEYAQGQLGDIVFVDVPVDGRKLEKGDEAAVVESVKAASDVYAPASGNVLEGNPALADQPDLVNSDPEGEGWFFRLTLSDASELEELMDETAYESFVAKL